MINDIISNLRKEDWIQNLVHHSNVYLVGGVVRDSLMKKPIKDIDMVVEGMSMDKIKNLLKHYGRVGIVGQSFAVVKFRPEGHTGEDFDIAVPRRDRKVGTGHKDFEIETEGLDIYDDLKRRDFTINSIAVNVRIGEVIDPFNGIADISARVLRATDQSAFAEDPLRIVRAIQFAARFQFDIEPKTLSLMRNNANLIKEISGERIREEFDKILAKKGSTRVAYDLIEKSDLDKALFRHKFSRDGFEYFDNLDPVSFYYILGILGDTTSSKFYKERLKGEANTIKALQTLEKHFDKFSEDKLEEEIKWNVFLMLRTSPILKDAKLIPQTALKVIQDMKIGKIPMKLGDIPVNGNDIMNKFRVKDEEVGNIIAKMYQDALMNKFDWKNKMKTLKYLENI